MHLALSRCAIRSWRRDDSKRLASIADDHSIWRMVRDVFPHPYTRADADAFIDMTSRQVPERSFAIVVDDEVIGSIGFVPGDDINRVRAEVGYWVCAEARGRGIATEALRGFVDWIWQSTDIQHLNAAVFSDNPASARVLENAGFALGYLARKAAIKDGLLRDEWIYYLVREGDSRTAAETGESDLG